MLEKEIKILNIDKANVIHRLEKLWAKKVFDGYIHDIYYDFVDGKSCKMDENNRLFRIRKKGNSYIYTIKRKRTKNCDFSVRGLKVADEAEREISNLEGFQRVLEKYGMQKTREKKKYRISYSYKGLEFDIDDYKGIPTLIELESDSKKSIKKYIKKLWLKNYIKKTFGSRWLYKFYGKKYSYL